MGRSAAIPLCGRLKRRHSFAGLTAYQARFIEIHADVKDSDDEDEQDETKAAHVGLETRCGQGSDSK